MNSIQSFVGKYRFLSNFYILNKPYLISFQGFEYLSVEHAYVAAKSISQNVWKHIANSNMSCGDVKNMAAK